MYLEFDSKKTVDEIYADMGRTFSGGPVVMPNKKFLASIKRDNATQLIFQGNDRNGSRFKVELEAYDLDVHVSAEDNSCLNILTVQK